MIAVKYDFIDSKTGRYTEELLFDKKRFVNAFGFDYREYITVKDDVEIFDMNLLYDFGLLFIIKDEHIREFFKTPDFISFSMKYDLETRSLELYFTNDTSRSVIGKARIYLADSEKKDDQATELLKLIRDMSSYFIQRHKEDSKALDAFVKHCTKIVGGKKGESDAKSVDVEKER